MHKVDDETLKAAREFLLRLKKKYTVHGAILYGSRARGDHSPSSDADLAVLIDRGGKEYIDIVFDMSDIAEDLLIEMGVDLSPLPLTLDEWNSPKKYSNPDLLRNIAKEGVAI